MALQSNADFRLLPVSSAFYPYFPFVIFHLLLSVCTQFHRLLFGRTVYIIQLHFQSLFMLDWRG